MTYAESEELEPGDVVYWTDPDDGSCSRYYTIFRSKVIGDTVCIADEDGNELECFPRELT